MGVCLPRLPLSPCGLSVSASPPPSLYGRLSLDASLPVSRRFALSSRDPSPMPSANIRFRIRSYSPVPGLGCGRVFWGPPCNPRDHVASSTSHTHTPAVLPFERVALVLQAGDFLRGRNSAPRSHAWVGGGEGLGAGSRRGSGSPLGAGHCPLARVGWQGAQAGETLNPAVRGVGG